MLSENSERERDRGSNQYLGKVVHELSKVKSSVVDQVLLKHRVNLLRRQQRRHLSQCCLAAASDVTAGVVEVEKQADQVGVDLFEESGARLTTSTETRQVSEESEGGVAHRVALLTSQQQHESKEENTT